MCPNALHRLSNTQVHCPRSTHLHQSPLISQTCTAARMGGLTSPFVLGRAQWRTRCASTHGRWIDVWRCLIQSQSLTKAMQVLSAAGDGPASQHGALCRTHQASPLNRSTIVAQACSIVRVVHNALRDAALSSGSVVVLTLTPHPVLPHGLHALPATLNMT